MSARDYVTEGITIHWDPGICQHSGVCAATLPAVFRPRERPWIDPHGATADEIAAMIDTCPSRALTYTRTAAGTSDATATGGRGEPVIAVRHVPAQTRYEILTDESVAGFAHYTPFEGRFVFDHTVIHDQYAGQGLGSALARGALDDVRAQQGRIVPLCPFITTWLDRHPEYDDLVDHDLLERILANS